MFFISQRQQLDAYEWTMRQIKRTHGFFGDEPRCLRLALGFRESSQIRAWQIEREDRSDHLYGLFANCAERGSQGFMPANDLVDGVLERFRIQDTLQAQSSGETKPRTIGFELIQKPQSLLIVRKREA